VTQVFTNHDQGINPSNPKLDQLDKLAHDLQVKKANTTEVGQIQMIDAALEKVNQAREEATVSQKITNNQARLGQYNQVKPAIQTQSSEPSQAVITDHEAQQIIKIKSVPSAVIQHGQKFASMSGKEPSNISYMKTNIQGLFDLVDLKNSDSE
tara:strand:+ start:168 stop:626 length:459 start_codon:yes stop_codon:yes gene_type:complete